MYNEIAAAVQSVKTLADLLNAARGLTNHVEVMTAVNAVQEKLSQALVVNLASMEKQAALAERVGELEKKIVEFEDWGREMERYSLTDLGSGVFAYALKPGMENGEPSHLLCAKCVSDHKKYLLQTLSKDEYRRVYVCHNCKSELRVDSGRTARALRDYDPLS